MKMAEGEGQFSGFVDSHYHVEGTTVDTNVLLSVGTNACTVSENQSGLEISGHSDPSGSEARYHVLSVPQSGQFQKDSLSYSVKIISPHTQLSGLVEKWEEEGKFDDIEILKEKMSLKFQSYIKESEYSLGFIQPGHGTKGRQVPVATNEDLSKMYQLHEGKKGIVLWLKVTRAKRLLPSSDTNSNSSAKKQNQGTNYSAHTQRMSEVQVITESLEKQHGDKFSKEQYTAWAHMLNMKKHDSYDAPPKKPFFKSKVVVAESSTKLSPGKRITYRSECIDQLDKWHTLLERGTISQEQFEELQATILNDIKHF